MHRKFQDIYSDMDFVNSFMRHHTHDNWGELIISSLKSNIFTVSIVLCSLLIPEIPFICLKLFETFLSLPR